MIYYLINLKNKTIGIFSKFIINIIKDKNFENIKIIIINEKFIKFNKKYKKKYIYKHTGYLGNIKKKSLTLIYKKNIREFVKNSLIRMFKNYKIKKLFKKNIKFLKKKNVKFLKNKILSF